MVCVLNESSLKCFFVFRIYNDKLDSINFQINQLSSNSHPELLRRMQKIENEFLERTSFNQMSRDYLLERVQHDFIAEKKAAAKEFEEKKIELKENLIADFEDKKRHVECERHNMELNGDPMEVIYIFYKCTYRKHPSFLVNDKLNQLLIFVSFR